MIAKRTVKLKDERLLILEAINARHIKLYTNSTNIQTFNNMDSEKEFITAITISDEFILDLNDPDLSNIKFKITDTFTSIYSITKITAVEKSTYLLETVERSNSSFFVPPLVVPSRDWIEWSRLFSNAYFVYFKNPINKYCIGLMFRFIPTSAFHILEDKLTNLESFYKHYPWDYNHELFTFVISKDQSNDLELLLESKYSKISEQYKQKILEFHGYSKTGDLAKVLYKHPDRRRQLELDLDVDNINNSIELFQVIDLDKELLKITDDTSSKLGRVGQL